MKMDTGIANIDSLCPSEIWLKTIKTGVKKANTRAKNTLVLWILGGMFVALGAIFAINTMTWLNHIVPYWIMKFLVWIAFCLWLALVVTVWWELFTGNVLVVVSLLQKKITYWQYFKNLLFVYLWNFVGSLIVVVLIFGAGHYLFSNWELGYTALYIAKWKLGYSFFQAVCLWIMCNILVCLAILVATGCRTIGDKLLWIFLPIVAFVAWWFEHSVANMFFMPYAWLIKNFWDLSKISSISDIDISKITVSNIIFNNIIPVTIGNWLWWAIFVWLIYWLTYCKEEVI